MWTIRRLLSTSGVDNIVLILLLHAFQDFFDLSVVNAVVAAAVGEKCTGEGLRDMHELVDQGLDLFAGRKFVESAGDHLDNIVWLYSDNFRKKWSHPPDTRIGPRFGIKRSDAVDIFSVNVIHIQSFNQFVDFFLYLRRFFVFH